MKKQQKEAEEERAKLLEQFKKEALAIAKEGDERMEEAREKIETLEEALKKAQARQQPPPAATPAATPRPVAAPSPSPALTKEEVFAKMQAQTAAQREAQHQAVLDAQAAKKAREEYLRSLTQLDGEVAQNVDGGLRIKLRNGKYVFLRGHPDQARFVDGSIVSCMAKGDGVYQYSSVGAGFITIYAYIYKGPPEPVRDPHGKMSGASFDN